MWRGTKRLPQKQPWISVNLWTHVEILRKRMQANKVRRQVRPIDQLTDGAAWFAEERLAHRSPLNQGIRVKAQ